MQYRGYCPEREVLAKYVKEAKSEFSHVLEKADQADLTPEERQKILAIQSDLEWLNKRLSPKNNS